MSILKVFKAWWKPEKIRVRFKHGVAIDVKYPKRCGYRPVKRAGEFINCNMYTRQAELINSLTARDQAIGMMNNPNPFGACGQAMQGNMLRDTTGRFI